VRVVQKGWWCEHEQLFFQHLWEHYTQRTALANDLPVGHYGYECEGRKDKIRAAVVVYDEEKR